MNKRLIMLALLATMSACSDDTAPSASVTCGDDQKLYEGTCHDKNECLPSCGDDQKCIAGECYANDACVPECDDGQKCIEGTCYDMDACTPACADTEKCIEGTCYDIHACVPECGDTEKCVEGECYDKDACIPECADTEKCVRSTCVSRDACVPECGEDERCEAGTCVPYDPTACEGKYCKDKVTYCDETGHWDTCEAGYGCHLGYCLKGLAPECTEPCSEDGTKYCQNGTWVSCGALETCQEGTCTLIETACEPGACSEDKRYYCDENNTLASCPIGTFCEDGQCTEENATENSLLWQPCTSNSDCARGMCVFELSTSRMTSIGTQGLSNIESIALSAIDPRIAPNTGVCAADCTRNPAICDTISTDKQKFTCQVVLTGDSPYPPKDQEGFDRSLPFHKHLKTSDLETAPYASICRPNDITGETYAESFCQTCTNSDECGGNESCIQGMCLPKCNTSEQCPFAFSCQTVNGMEQSFCVPNTNTCSACLDLDGDGMGHGACPKTGFDCDDFRSDIYYNKQLSPDSCTTNYTDDNCNGKIDYLELIGSPDNCSTCGSTCKTPENAKSINHVCILDNNNRSLDDASPESIAQTYVYACQVTCDPGYADCDGDPSNGCEVQLLDIKENGSVQVTANAIKYTTDADKDGHGVMDDGASHYCCKSKTNVCYALPDTDANTTPYWDKATLNSQTTYSSTIDDCDDNNKQRFPGNTELCDGIDNDCRSDTADGSGVYIKLSGTQYVAAQSSDAKKLGLGATCTVYHNDTGSVCSTGGKVECRANQSSLGTSYTMLCTTKTTGDDVSCNNIDDNCDGTVDEGYVPTDCTITNAKGICKLGVKVCSAGKETCVPLYTARPVDFYGDGVDSDCDGYDWDNDHAVFIDAYGTGTSEGNDSHTGRMNSPLATLTKAFKQAEASQDGKTLYHDIIVSSSVKTTTSQNNKWGKETIAIPTVNTTSRYNNITLKSAKTHLEHVELYKQALKNSESYSANDYLFKEGNTSEVYPPKEVIRIYGGFDFIYATFSPSNSKYHRELAESNNKLTANLYTLITPNGTYPMSLKLQQFEFMLQAASNQTIKPTGTTLIGMTCGKYGCSELTLKNTTFEITAPDGNDESMTQHASNEIWNASQRNGVNGRHKNYDEDTSANYTNYSKNYQSNACMSVFYIDNIWRNYSDYYSTWVNKCPDGSSPTGGCGSVNCCQGACKNIQTNPRGKSGYGPGAGAGADITSANRGSGCNSNSSVDASKPTGQPGANGAGGAGGTTQKLKIQPEISASGELYLATYSDGIKDSIASAYGKAGTSGGGGGGGGIYHCYDHQTSNFDSWGWAGNGGAGGCGGAGGKAGGTGGSAIGLILTPPKSGSSAISISSTGTPFIITAGTGGNGQPGQSGIEGGRGGECTGYAKEGAFDIDTHCFKATAGGAGGSGGGGGGGSAGLAGQAYGIFFLCNRNVTFNALDKTQFTNCGFNVDDNLLSKPANYASVEAMNNGAYGSPGSDAKWNDALNLTLSGANASANKKSIAGTLGAAGTGQRTNDAATATAIHMHKTTAF